MRLRCGRAFRVRRQSAAEKGYYVLYRNDFKIAMIYCVKLIGFAGNLWFPACKGIVFYGNSAQCGKSRFRENMGSDDDTFSQMYFVYLKKK